MIRVQRSKDPTSRPARSPTTDRIHISRRRTDPLRVTYPANGSTTEGGTLRVVGTASPGASLRMQAGNGDETACTVRADGNWAMPALSLAPGEHELSVVDVEQPHRVAKVSFVVAFLRSISVVSPLEGETLEARSLEVTGKASPGRLVCLRLEHTTLTERCDDRGSFRFQDVELASWGQQNLLFFYAEEPDQGAAELVLHWPGLDLPSLVDPLTRTQLKPGADVLRCASCYTYCYRASWNRLNRCPRCLRSGAFWARSDLRFHTPRPMLSGE